jgi:hypothetical protein
MDQSKKIWRGCFVVALDYKFLNNLHFSFLKIASTWTSGVANNVIFHIIWLYPPMMITNNHKNLWIEHEFFF